MKILIENNYNFSSTSRKLAKKARERMAKIRTERKEVNICVRNKTHGEVYRGNRCKICWDIKLAGEREARRLLALEEYEENGSKITA